MKSKLQRCKNYALLKTTYLNNRGLDEHYINCLLDMENFDEYYYRVYTLGQWSARKAGSRVYKRFSEANIIEKFEYDEYKELILCTDFNIAPMKWCFIQNVKGIDYVFDEIVKKDTDTTEMAEEVLKKYGNRDYIVYGDRSGMASNTNSRTTDFQLIKRILPDTEIRVRSKNPFVIDRVNAVNIRLCDENQKIKLYIAQNCKHLIKDLYRVEWLKGKRNIDKSNMELTHISDALGYYIEYNYSIKPQPVYHYSRSV